jgi:CubicO group peptidase (beta-lactamase class C family)
MTGVCRSALAFALLLGIGLHGAPRQEPAKAKPDHLPGASERFERIHRLIQEHVDRKQIAGAVVLVLHRGKPVYFEGIGKADVEAKTPMARDTLFRIASMTKPITSVAVLMLAEEGKLRLSDPVSKYLPEFKGAQVAVRSTASGWTIVPAQRAITIHDLLTHTSGILYGFTEHAYLSKLYRDAGVSDGLVQTDLTLAQNIQRLAKLPLAHQPGAAWSYGLSLDVLGRVVEVLSGMPLDAFFHQRIFEPLGLKDTSFYLPEEKRNRLAALYVPGKDKTIVRVDDKPRWRGNLHYSASFPYGDTRKYYSGGAGLVSTAADYGRFLEMLLHGGERNGKRLLKPETVAQMTRNQVGTLQIPFRVHGDGFGYGFGVVTGREKPPSPAPVGSYSWGGIFHTFFWVDPKDQLIGIVLTQLYPFDHLTLWQDFQAKAYEDLADSRAPAKRTNGQEKPLSRVRVSEVTIHGDMDCFQIETPNATYRYGKKGAGFASILDPDGRDWISYRPGDKAKGEYRGLPKCGQPTKYFHCGYGYGQYKTDNVFTSTVTVQEADHVRVRSETRDQKSACTWDFYPTHATLTLLRIDAPTFWFLYEGTPGGRLHPDKDFVICPDGRKTTLDEPWSEVIPWVCFGTKESPIGFVCVNHQEPEKGQTDSYVSWPFVKDKDGSFQDMTVFGFGRKGYRELVQHVPDLTRLPARYSIAFIRSADHATAKALCEKLCRTPLPR